MNRLLSMGLLAAGLIAAAPGPQAAAQPEFLEITIPVYSSLNPALRPPIALYAWETADGDTDPAEVRYIMVNTADHGSSYPQTAAYIQGNPNAPEWSAWGPYAPPDVGTSWASPPLDYGNYVFAVQGRDGTGAAEAVQEPRNIRRVRVAARTTGPLLTVTGDLIDPIVTSTITTPVTEVDAAPGTPISFCLEADASAYGGIVAGYRTDWDVADPDDDDAWSSGFVAYPGGVVCSTARAFSAGSHTFYAEAVDNDGYKSRVPILVHILGPSAVGTSTWGRVKALYR